VNPRAMEKATGTIPGAQPQAPNPAGQAHLRTPLAQLLHALNQPLTGLQCSMEVALAGPRTPAQHVHLLREGLELTGRMRALVGALREVADAEEGPEAGLENFECIRLLQDALLDLKPVAEANGVRCQLQGGTACWAALKVEPRKLATIAFRLLESILSLAARGSEMRIVAGSVSGEVEVLLHWRPASNPSALSAPELGLLVAQAALERAGARWQRERGEVFETLTVRLAEIPRGRM